MKVFVILTSFNEEQTIGKAVEQIIVPNKDLWSKLHLIVTAPDSRTLKIAEEVCQKHSFNNLIIVQDEGIGKAEALNKSVEAIRNNHTISPEEDLLVLTDGDVYVSDMAIKNLLNSFKDPLVGGVGGHPVSQDSKNSMFGYFSHLFCQAAHVSRLNNLNIPMSGYLLAVRFYKDIFPIPAKARAEDAYISAKVVSLGGKVVYEPEALIYVKFPRNLKDWLKQKTRSLGGNVQLSTISGNSSRSIMQDLKMIFFPLFFASNVREFTWSLALYPLRLYLWVRIYFNHLFNRYKSGAWERIESTK